MCCVLIDIHVLLFSFSSFSLSPRKSIFLLLFILFFIFFSARCSWPSSNQSRNDATTHLLFTLIRSISLSHTFFFSLSYNHQLSLTLSRLSLLIVYFLSLFLSHRTHDAHFFYTCVCVCSLFSSFLLCVCLPLLII